MSNSRIPIFLRLLSQPNRLLPHATLPTFAALPVPISQAFASQGNWTSAKARSGSTTAAPEIRGVVLDKDNCFARDGEQKVWKDYEPTLQRLRAAYPHSLLVVSNSAGSSSDSSGAQATQLEANIGVPVLRHMAKKPACGADIMAWYRARPETGVTHGAQVAVVGDRLLTDVVLAAEMGAWSVWVKDGVDGDRGLVSFDI